MIDRKWDFHINFAFSEFSRFSICFPDHLQDVCVSFLFFCWSLCFVLICGTLYGFRSLIFCCVFLTHHLFFNMLCMYFDIQIHYICKFFKLLSVLCGSHIMHSDWILPISQSPEFALHHCNLLPQIKQNLKEKPKQTNKTKTTKSKTKQRRISL